VPPPGGNGTTKRTGFSGYASAACTAAVANAMDAPINIMRKTIPLLPEDVS
jgi:hypothetical protein